MSDDITAILKRIDEQERAADEHVKKTTVLFTDLSDSTEYKAKKGQFRGLVKTYRHNDICVNIITDLGGEIVKYLGDGVMATFRENHEGITKAVESAIQIQERCKSYNEILELREDFDKIRTKIGIHSGEVYFQPFQGQKTLDPQGNTVDIAARITALAKPNQILCSEMIKEECLNRDINFNDKFYRELKGISGNVAIYEVIWSGGGEGVKETEHYSLKTPEIEKFLTSAREFERKEGYNDAIETYKHILQFHDAKHFTANISIANIYLRNLQNAEEAYPYIQTAINSNPLSAFAKQLHGVIRWKIYSNKYGEQNIPEQMLEELITEGEAVSKIAEEILDIQLEVLAKNSLAYYYAQRYENKMDSKDLDRAIDLCDYIDVKYKWIRANQDASFLDTYAFVLVKKDDIDSLKKARNILEDASKMNPNNAYIHHHKAEVIRLLQSKGCLK